MNATGWNCRSVAVASPHIRKPAVLTDIYNLTARSPTLLRQFEFMWGESPFMINYVNFEDGPQRNK